MSGRPRGRRPFSRREQGRGASSSSNMPIRRRDGNNYANDDDDSQDPTYDPSLDNVYQPGEEIATDEDEEEDENMDDDDDGENGDYEESPDAGYQNFHEFMDEIAEESRARYERNRGGGGRRIRVEVDPVEVESDFSEESQERAGTEERSRPSTAEPPAPSHQVQPPPPQPPSRGNNASDSDDDVHVLHVRTRKRSRVMSQDEEDEENKPPPAPSPAVEEDDDDDVGCTICYEEFTSNGEHRLVSLKCGHFFGKNCIERWIRAEGRAATCPTCKAKALIKDVRVHFMRSVKMTDNSELEQLRVSNQEYKRKVDSLEMTKARLEEQLVVMHNLFETKDVRGREVKPANVTAVRGGTMALKTCSRGELALPGKTTSSKAFDFNGFYFAVGVHCPEAGAMFSPYGIKKTWFEGNLLAKGTIVPMHSNRSRVVLFSPYESDIVLSAGEDKMAAVNHMANSQSKRTWHVPVAVWSGCWLTESRFALGLANGRVYEFDRTSSSTEPVRDITMGIGKMPIIFIGHDFESSVVLVASFKKLVAFHGSRAIPFLSNDTDGYDSIRSVAWDPRTLHFCVTFGASAGKPISHRLYRLDVSNLPDVSFVEVNQWITNHKISTTLWNNCLFSTEDGIFSLIFSEDSRQLEVHDWSKGRPNVVLGFSNSESPCDMKVVESIAHNEKKIAILTERHIFTVYFKTLP